MSLVYLASPYSLYPAGREAAFTRVCKKAAQLMLDGEHVFCPIAHSHPIEVEGMEDVQDGEFWLDQDFAILEKCDALYIYQMAGWDESIGVNAELMFALANDIPVYYLED